MHLKTLWYSHDYRLRKMEKLSYSLSLSLLNLKSRRLPSTSAHTSRISCVNQFEIRLFFAVSTSFPELLARLVTIRPVELLELLAGRRQKDGKRGRTERGKRGISRRLDQQVFETLIMEGITEDALVAALEYSRGCAVTTLI